MNYVSTRNKNLKVSSAKAIATGISAEGGLFCPESFPSITKEEVLSLCKMTYKERATYILGKFLSDFTETELKDMAAKAYANEKFGGEDTAPVVKLAGGKYIQELWHGPTLAFKDMALQMLPHLLTASLKKIGETRTVCILVATSGDTGKAALDGFMDVEGTKIMVYFPSTGVSQVQKLQMNTQEGKNVNVVAINGNFDDAQSAVKRIFTDKETAVKLDKDGLVLSSANSINWGRLVPQIVYYISAYCDLISKGEISYGEKINVCVPTGNFGNILASYLAKQMGLPINKFICASNANNVLTDFFATGTYDRNRNFYVTNSPSMDILISSNLERLLFYVSGHNDEMVKDLMAKLASDGKYSLESDVYAKIQSEFAAGYCDDTDTKATIKKVWEEENYLMDTHTAVAVKVLEDYVKETGDTTKTVVASTASPYKFSKDVLAAIGEDTSSEELKLIDVLEEVSKLKMPASLEKLKTAEVRFNTTIEKDEILDSIKWLSM